MIVDQVGQEDIILPSQRQPALSRYSSSCYGKPEGGPLIIIFFSSALDTVMKHLSSNMSMELGGVLIGEVCQWNGRMYVEIRSCLPARNTDHSPIHFTFAPQSWVELSELIESRYPNYYMVGWYHSHPQLGVFFSSQDRDVHKVVFNQPWHVALVIDPSTEQLGFYGWVNGQIERMPGYFRLDDAEPHPQQTPGPKPMGIHWIIEEVESIYARIGHVRQRLMELNSQLAGTEKENTDIRPSVSLSVSDQMFALRLWASVDDDADFVALADRSLFPVGCQLNVRWEIGNCSNKRLQITNTRLELRVTANHDVTIISPDKLSEAPDWLEPGMSITAEGHTTLATQGSYDLVADVQTRDDEQWIAVGWLDDAEKTTCAHFVVR